ncbi:MAG: DUF6785 family protein [Armatimonadota bacterium]
MTFRSFIICIFALLLMGMWNEYHTGFLSTMGEPMLENSPPNGAITTLVIVLFIAALLYRFRKSFGLLTAELVVIYAALLIAAPMMTQGLWHRLFGLVAALPHDQDFKSYESLPSMLWPHGDNLVVNGRFVDGLKPFTVTGSSPDDYTQDFIKQIGEQDIVWRDATWTLPRLTNVEKETARSQFEYTIPRYREQGGRKTEQLVPGESYLFSCLVRAADFKSGSHYFVRMKVDDGPMRTVLLDAGVTPKTFANPTGLKRIGKCPVIIPSELKEKLTLAIGLAGPGNLVIHDVEFMNSKAVESAYTGVKVARQQNLRPTKMENGREVPNPNYLPENERDNLVIKPDNMFSLAGMGYLLQGFIPMQQWIIPMFAWSLLIGALFMGFFGVNVIMRKQWVESERFTYPMNLFPRQFFGEDAVDIGDMLRKLLSNKVLWMGFAVMLPLVLLKGIKFYIPSVPAPDFGDMWMNKSLGHYVTHPLLKAFLNQAGVNLTFSLFAIALLIETDILLSIWVFFFLFQLWQLFGQAFNFTRFEGYPWQWSQVVGAFVGYALMAILAARRHLANVFRQVFGLKKREDQSEVVSYRTAFIMVLASLVIIGCWGVWTHMGLKAALLFFGWILICGLTASKIRAEAGLPFGYWMPYFGMIFVGAMGGFVTFGTTGMLVAAIVSGFIGVSCFYFIAPAQVEMMELGRHFKVRPRDVGWGLLLGLLGGLFIGGFTFMSWAYGKGADNFSFSWPYVQGSWYYKQTFISGEAAIDSAFAANKLADPKTAPLDVVHNINAKGVGIGFVLTIAFSLLRQTFMWFPLHPLGYVVSAAHFGRILWFTCFLAWFVRFVTLRIGGTHTVRKGLVPFAVGMFLACIVSIIIFEIVGFYFQSQGMTRVYCNWP